MSYHAHLFTRTPSRAIAGMPLKRYSTSVDGTIPVPALLYEDEVVLTFQDNVGIYDGWVSTGPRQPSRSSASSHISHHTVHKSPSTTRQELSTRLRIVCSTLMPRIRFRARSPSTSFTSRGQSIMRASSRAHPRLHSI